MHSLAQTFRPRSAAAASTTGLSLGPAPASIPPPPRPGGGPPWRPPAGGGVCGAWAAAIIAPAATNTAIANPLVIVPSVRRRRAPSAKPSAFCRTDRQCASRPRSGKLLAGTRTLGAARRRGRDALAPQALHGGGHRARDFRSVDPPFG